MRKFKFPFLNHKKEKLTAVTSENNLPEWEDYRESKRFTDMYSFYSECIKAAIESGLTWAEELNEWIEGVFRGDASDALTSAILNPDCHALLECINEASKPIGPPLKDRTGVAYISPVDIHADVNINGRIALFCDLKADMVSGNNTGVFVSIAFPHKKQIDPSNIDERLLEQGASSFYYIGDIARIRDKLNEVHPEINVIPVSCSGITIRQSGYFRCFHDAYTESEYGFSGIDGLIYRHIGPSMSEALGTNANIYSAVGVGSGAECTTLQIDTSEKEAIMISHHEYVSLTYVAEKLQVKKAISLRDEGKSFVLVTPDGKSRVDGFIDDEGEVASHGILGVIALGEKWFVEEVKSFDDSYCRSTENWEKLKRSGIDVDILDCEK
ncbi:hypothetical protein [Vibrio phage BONAISHI]|nr:hypothetical protein [Vibrio phage BONAISHI]